MFWDDRDASTATNDSTEEGLVMDSAIFQQAQEETPNVAKVEVRGIESSVRHRRGSAAVITPTASAHTTASRLRTSGSASHRPAHC